MSSNFCPNCGNKIDEGEKFCSNCGTAILSIPQEVITIPKTSVLDTQHLVWTGRRSLRSLWFWFIMSIFLIGIPVLLYLYYDNKYTITPNRVIAQYGILSKREFSARKNQITDIYTTQGVVARLMGVGDVVINTAGTSAYEVKFKGVANPTEIKERLLRSFGE